MFVLKYARKHNTSTLLNLVQKGRYSRRSDKSISSYKVVNSNNENLDDVDGAVLGTNSNWELLTPRGFRFYLPGSIGPGWLDINTTAQVRRDLVDLPYEKNNDLYQDQLNDTARNDKTQILQPTLHCVAQECPFLLRKSVQELFPGNRDVFSSQLTIITISQKTNFKSMRWSKEAETEKLAKYFVLAASDICTKIKLIGYWADFINPFSGQPHLNPQKNNTLYKTDERFRCLGFKVQQKNNCKVISYASDTKNFVGSLYTTAPASTEFLEEILSNYELVNVNND